MIIKNWKDNPPSIVHKSGIDWRILSNKNQIDDIQKDTDANCLEMIKFVSLAWLQPSQSYEPHKHPWEEVYYIIKGKGKIRVDQQTKEISDGCAIYIPPDAEHEIINTSDEMIEFLAFAADIK